MSVAINKFFGTLLSGRSKNRQDLVEQAIPLEVTLYMLPCRGGEKILRCLFEPLGYKVEAIHYLLDEKFPEWQYSFYYTVTLSRTCSLREFLMHLYVLIPVLDNDKHYWIGDDEVQKLLKFGEGWLASHPEKDLITRRYLKNFSSLVNVALAHLSEDQSENEINEVGEIVLSREELLEQKINLNQQRIEWVQNKLKAHHAKRVVDMGCGEGKLLSKLLRDSFFDEIVGCDVSSRVLEMAKERLKIERLSPSQQKRIQLLQTSLTYGDTRLAGYDAAILLEVIEHVDFSRLDALKRAIFEVARPNLILITTPNAEYNVLFENLAVGKFRHPDHRFEWSRAEFQNWALQVAEQFGYTVTLENIGDYHPQFGSPTQAGVFVRNDK